MSTFTFGWSHVLMGGVILLLLFVVIGVVVTSIVLYMRKPGTTPLQAFESEVKAVEGAVKKAAATPAGQMLKLDMEKLGSIVADKLSKKMAAAPPMTVPNHPLVTAALDAVQEEFAAKAKVAKITAAVTAATDTVAAVASPAAPAPTPAA